MDEVLTELFYGNIRPIESCPETKEYKELSEDLQRIYCEFVDHLNKYNKELENEFTEIINRKNLLLAIENEKAFQDGFCLGVQLIISAYH